jgi:hypothetical protein
LPRNRQSKGPIDACLPGVASVFPRGYCIRHQASILQSSVETSTAYDVDLGLRHVRPTLAGRSKKPRDTSQLEPEPREDFWN